MNKSFKTGEIAELTFRQLKRLSTQKTTTCASRELSYNFLEVVKKFSLSY